MKQTLHTLCLAVLCIMLASCSTTRKVANTKEQHDSTTSVATEQQSQTVTNDAQTMFATETDKSTIVIEFVKTEYADGTTDITTSTGADVQNGMKMRGEREATEPPNVGKGVKSVTSGRVTINNDKKRQEDTNLQHSEATQTQEASSVEATENSKSQNEVTEQPKSNLFLWGVAAGLLAVISIGITLLLYRLKRK